MTWTRTRPATPLVRKLIRGHGGFPHGIVLVVFYDDAMPKTDTCLWYDKGSDNPPWIRALADIRHRATLDGHCDHVQAIVVAIDQYANRHWATDGTF